MRWSCSPHGGAGETQPKRGVYMEHFDPIPRVTWRPRGVAASRGLFKTARVCGLACSGTAALLGAFQCGLGCAYNPCINYAQSVHGAYSKLSSTGAQPRNISIRSSSCSQNHFLLPALYTCFVNGPPSCLIRCYLDFAWLFFSQAKNQRPKNSSPIAHIRIRLPHITYAPSAIQFR